MGRRKKVTNPVEVEVQGPDAEEYRVLPEPEAPEVKTAAPAKPSLGVETPEVKMVTPTPDPPVAPSSDDEVAQPQGLTPGIIANKEEEVWWVKFHDKTHPSDPADVVLSVNGDVMQIKRQNKIPLPYRYVEAAKHANYPQFQQLPGEQRKRVATIEKYPFDFLGKAEWKDFYKFCREGTETARKSRDELSD
jgi:hypothetical protein